MELKVTEDTRFVILPKLLAYRHRACISFWGLFWKYIYEICLTRHEFIGPNQQVILESNGKLNRVEGLQLPKEPQKLFFSFAYFLMWWHSRTNSGDEVKITVILKTLIINDILNLSGCRYIRLFNAPSHKLDSMAIFEVREGYL